MECIKGVIDSMVYDQLTIELHEFRIRILGRRECFWQYHLEQENYYYDIQAPSLEIDGQLVTVELDQIRAVGSPVNLSNGAKEYTFSGTFVADPQMSLQMVFRLHQDEPIIRFRYVLHSQGAHRMTKVSGEDAILYFATSLSKGQRIKEVQLSGFNEWVHSFSPFERPYDKREFTHEVHVMGPILAIEDDDHQFLLAYEHGSQVPDAFLAFNLSQNGTVRLQGVKGNYVTGQPLSSGFATVWMQTGAVRGTEASLAHAYRQFVLKHMAIQVESRQPYIFYNTWAFQERNKHWNHKPYLESMVQERILREIEVAHRMGVEVFVMDTGWYEKTGDWQVSLARFPDSLKCVKEALDTYGMKLGLWLGPTSVAISSELYDRYRDCAMSWHGKVRSPRAVWETEESQDMCLVSDYADALVERMITLSQTLGVKYFKWDAIGQYGCDSPLHQHGGDQHSQKERVDSYAFQIGLVLTKIVEKVTQQCPDVIVDFDVTEGQRAFGLAFLSVGKYFLINNGPYYHNYDLPVGLNDGNWNIFFYPGQARGWVCRYPLAFDRWIPSVLFLTHYLPDDPEESQWMNLASLMLGQNGIWGDLLSVSVDGVRRFGETLGKYKQIRADITEASPVRLGDVGGSPEIHEKISPMTRKGIVAIFSPVAGRYTYVTRSAVEPNYWHTEGVHITLDAESHARIDVHFDAPGAHIVMFGVS